MSRVVRITAAVASFAWVLGYAAPADASCVGPQLTVDRATVAVGDVITIHGSWFGTACNDTGQGGRVLGAPQSFISVRLVQGDSVVPLVEVDADGDYRFVVQVMVPTTLTTGPASVTASSSRLSDATGAHGTVAAAFVVTDSGTTMPTAAPPTIVVGRDSTLPAAALSGGSHTRLVVGGVIAAVVLAIGVGVIVYRREQRRPHVWIHAPERGRP